MSGRHSFLKARQKAAKNREVYEKAFLGMKKAREEREGFIRVGRLIKSDAEMEEVMDGLQEQQMQVLQGRPQSMSCHHLMLH